MEDTASAVEDTDARQPRLAAVSKSSGARSAVAEQRPFLSSADGGPYGHPHGRIPSTPPGLQPWHREPSQCAACGTPETGLEKLKVRSDSENRRWGSRRALWCEVCDRAQTLDFEKWFWASASPQEQRTMDDTLDACLAMSTQIQRSIRVRAAAAGRTTSAVSAAVPEAHSKAPPSRAPPEFHLLRIVSQASPAVAARWCAGCGRAETFIQHFVMRSDTDALTWCSTCNKAEELVVQCPTWKEATKQEKLVMESFLEAALDLGQLIRANSRTRCDDPIVALLTC